MEETPKTILRRATKTTNYYTFKFNKITKNREILFAGAVPLHKIIYILYDFYYNYLHSAAPKTVTYLSLIINQNSNSRPETPYIIKLEGASSKKKRLANIRNSIPGIIEGFNQVFNTFVTEAGLQGEAYRKDSSTAECKKARDDFNQDICPKLEALIV